MPDKPENALIHLSIEAGEHPREQLQLQLAGILGIITQVNRASLQDKK
jgi:hypothetical protein